MPNPTSDISHIIAVTTAALFEIGVPVFAFCETHISGAFFNLTIGKIGGQPFRAELTAIEAVFPPIPLEETFSPEEIAEMSEAEREQLQREGGGVLLRPLEDVIAEAEEPEDVWLWCMHCYRFFQVKHLVIDYLGNRQGCPLCGAAGLSVDIFLWNTEAINDPGWPKSIEELHFGMRSPTGT